MRRADYKSFMTAGAIVDASRVPGTAEETIKVRIEPIKRSESSYYLLSILDFLSTAGAVGPGFANVPIEIHMGNDPNNPAKALTVADVRVDLEININRIPSKAMMLGPISELYVAFTATDLKQSHIKTWALSHNIPGDCAELLKDWLPVVTRYIDVTAAMAKSERTTWLSYRLTSQSTSTLCKIALEGLGSAQNYVFTPAEIASITASSPFDLVSGVNPAAIAKSFVYLDVTGYNFGAWYQGRKAVASWSTSEAIKLRLVIAESIKKKVSKDLIDLAKTSEDVIALAGITGDAVMARTSLEVAKTESEAWAAAVKYMNKRGLDAVSIPEGVTPNEVADAATKITEFERKVNALLEQKASV